MAQVAETWERDSAAGKSVACEIARERGLNRKKKRNGEKSYFGSIVWRFGENCVGGVQFFGIILAYLKKKLYLSMSKDT